MNNKLKTLIAILIILTLCSGIFYIVSRNKSELAESETVESKTIPDSAFPDMITGAAMGNGRYASGYDIVDLYCINHRDVWPNTTKIYKSGSANQLSKEEAYYIYENYEQRTLDSMEYDTIASLFWGGGSAVSEKSIAYADPKVSIQGPEPKDQPIIENGNKIGTFYVEYPNINGELDEGAEVTVRLNGKIIPTKQQYDFDVSEVKYGELNELTIEYEYYQIYGATAIYVPDATYIRINGEWEEDELPTEWYMNEAWNRVVDWRRS